MKKVVFVVAVCFTFLIIPNTVLADLEEDYATALKYYNTGKYEEAVTYFKAYVENKPDPNAYYRIGYALYELGRHDEAMEYFQAAYLIDPEVSPSPAEFIEQYKRGKARRELVPPVMEPEPQPAPQEQPQVKKEAPALTEKAAVGVTPAIPGAPVEKKREEPIAPPPVTEEPVSKPEPDRFALPKEIQPPSGIPPLAQPEGEMPFEIPPGLIAVMAGLGIIFQIIGLVLTLFFLVCYFLIGRRLDVPHSWIAFIPILNYFWPILGTARKSVKWGLLYLLVLPIVAGILATILAAVSPMLAMAVIGIITIVVLVVYVYLWMLTTENLGKNRWLGLLIILPIIQIIFVAFLAFSKTDDASRYYVGEPLT